MIPRLKPALGWKELTAAFSLPKQNDVERFEKAFAEKMGQKHAIAFPYGRTGIVMLLEALGLKGKEVICPAYTCVVVPHAIVTSGNEPVFVDSQEYDFNMDLGLVEEAITEKTGAIIATSIFGYPVNLDKLDMIKKEYPHIHIIQDCAHSFAAEWKGRPVQKEGVAAVFGLNISKLMTSIFGGMITTDDGELAERLVDLRNRKLKPASTNKSLRRFLYLLTVYPAFWGPVYGMVNWIERMGWLNYFVKYYDESEIDMPNDYLESMSKVEARVGIAQLSRYDKIIEERRSMAVYYHAHLECDNIPPLVEGATYSHFVVRTMNKDEQLNRSLQKSIQLGELIEYSIPDMTSYRASKFIQSSFNWTQYFANHVINIPIWCGIFAQKGKLLDALKSLNENCGGRKNT